MATHLLNAMQAELIAQGIARKPSVAGAPPPMFLEPPLGVPAPGEGQAPMLDANLVLGTFMVNGIAPGPLASWHRQPIVDLRIRAARDKAYLAEDIELAVTKALIDRRDFLLGTGGAQLHVIECLQWRALQRLGSDEQGTEFVTSYVFELLRP
jgi:hypothetical protein